MLTKCSIVVATKDQISTRVGDEAVILGLKDGVYYGLNSVGASIWHLLQEPVKVESLHQAILDEYDVEPEQCLRDLLAILHELHSKRLIARVDDHGATG